MIDADDHPFKCVCTACGQDHTHAGSLEVSQAPQSGDIMICLTCQHIMIVGSDMHLRDPTDAEAYQIAGDQDLIRYQRAIAATKSAGKYRQAGGEETS
jgi:hypothetical protein